MDCLENYDSVNEVIMQVVMNADNDLQSFINVREDVMKRICRRNFGGKLIRMGTPIEKTYHGNVQSPSKNKSDIYILPGVTLQQSEDNKKKFDKSGNEKKDLRRKAQSTGRTENTSGVAKKVDSAIGHINKPKREYHDYLTVMRKERETALRQAGNNKINWQEVVERAKMMRNVKNKQTIILSHLGEDAAILA